MLKQIMGVLVGRQQGRCNFAVPAGPMEQDFLLLFRQIVWCVGLANIPVHATGWVTEEEALEPLSLGGFVYWSIIEGLFVQLNVGRRSAENGLDDFLAGLDGSPDLFCYQACSLQ